MNTALKQLSHLLPDKIYLSIKFRMRMGKWIDWKNPTTFNEKLQWLKLYDRKPVYVTIVDKYEVKKYVSTFIGSQYIIPTIGVWDQFDEIDFDRLPDQFVLKCTHDSGGLVICKNKKEFNKTEAKNVLERCLRNNYYWDGREWAYKNVKPRIIAEAYLEDESTRELRDYKFFTFDGKVKLMFVATQRQNAAEDTKFDFFDEKYNHLNIKNGHENATVVPEKPLHFEEMIRLAEVLGKGFPHLRVDFYEVNGQVFFGELTLSHWSGLVPFVPGEWDTTIGNWLKLPK